MTTDAKNNKPNTLQSYDAAAFARDLDKAILEIRNLLVRKNEAYGDALLNPVRIFSKASTDEQISVRLDDKLSRLVRGENAGEDVELDLLGYLLMKRVWRQRNV